MSAHRTTETLREILFDAAAALREGKMSREDTKAMVDIARTVVQTAELEIKYAATLLKLDKSESGITPGPMLLTQNASKEK